MLNSASLNRIIEPQLFLCKPNRTTIHPITNAIGLNRQVNLGKLNEINFSLPYEIEKNNQLIRNPLVNLVKERYFIRVEQGNEKEWFIINEINESMDQDKDLMSIHAFSLGYELNNKELRYYECTSKNVTQILTEILSETIWTIGYIDADFDILNRSFEVSDRSILDFIYEVADKFGADVIFDSNKRTVNFYKFENIGNFLGLTVSLGKLLKSMNRSSFPDEMVNVLKAFGKDGLTFNDVNPSGTNFIEDFTFLMHPFELTEDGVTVLQHSHHLSDELCIALVKYKKLLDSKSEEYQFLLENKSDKQNILAIKENELSSLNIDLALIEDRLAVGNATGSDVSLIIQEKQQKENEMNAKKDEIEFIENEIELINSHIENLRAIFAIENNFTSAELKEKKQHELVRNWTNENITDSKDLLEEAKKHLDKVRFPRVNFEVDIINFLAVLDEKHNWDRLHIGDTILIHYEKFNVKVKAKIVSIEFDYDTHSIKLQIANFTDMNEDWAKMLRQSYTTSSNLNSEKYKWNEASGKLGEINDLIDGEFDATKRRILGGVNQSVEFSNKGLIAKSIDNPNDILVLQAGLLAISNDNLNSIQVAISPRGVVAERLYGKVIAGVNLTIENDSGKFTFDSNGATLKNNSFRLESETGGNGITISPSDGLVSTKSDNTIKTTLNATEGIKIEKYESNLWKKKFYVDTNGILTAEDLIANRLIFKNGSDILIDGTTRTIDFSKFTTKLGSVFLNNIPILDLISDFNNNRQEQFHGGIIQTGTLVADKITTGTLKAKVSNIYDCEVGGTLTIGNNGNPTMALYTSLGAHRIVSADSAGLRMQASSIGLVASSGTGVYVPNSNLVAQAGFRVTGGVVDIQVPAYINNATIATENHVSSRIAQLETDIKLWANSKFVEK